MTEIKRPNYFTSQFLVEKDFKDEQAYHLSMRRRHNQRLHSWGIVYGLEVSGTGKQASVTPGMAIDKDGQEIVLPDDPPPKPIDLSTFGGNANVYVTVAYQEVSDPADRYTAGGVDNFSRTTERATIAASLTVPPNDGSTIAIALLKLDKDGNIGSQSIDLSVRKQAGAAIGPGTIDTAQLRNGAVSGDKLAPSVQQAIAAPPVSINRVSNPAGNIDLIPTNAITIVPDNVRETITIGESHSGRRDNPHGVTAAQVGALPLTGGTVTGDVVANGNLAVGAFTIPGTKGISVAGPNAQIAFVDRKLNSWPASPAAGNSFIWYADTGVARLFTPVIGDLLSVNNVGDVNIRGKIFQEGWQTPVLTGGWVIYTGSREFNPPGFFKDSLGIVHLRGMVGGGNIQLGIFQLPEGYRPAFRELHIVMATDTVGRVDIRTDGVVLPVIGPINKDSSYLSLDGITFRAA